MMMRFAIFRAREGRWVVRSWLRWMNLPRYVILCRGKNERKRTVKEKDEKLMQDRKTVQRQ